MDGQANDKALQKFADLMVKKLTEVDADWHKPWFTTTGYGLPQNIDGRVYNGINSFMLFLLQEERSFQTPVYMTFPQAKKQGLHINKGASAFPRTGRRNDTGIIPQRILFFASNGYTDCCLEKDSRFQRLGYLSSGICN